MKASAERLVEAGSSGRERLNAYMCTVAVADVAAVHRVGQEHIHQVLT